MNYATICEKINKPMIFFNLGRLETMIKNALSFLLLISTGIYLIFQSIITSNNNILIDFSIIGILLFYLVGIYSHIKEIK